MSNKRTSTYRSGKRSAAARTTTLTRRAIRAHKYAAVR